jgi:hypothetical protein
MKFRIFHLLMAMVFIAAVSMCVGGCKQYVTHFTQFGHDPCMLYGELKVWAGIFTFAIGCAVVGGRKDRQYRIERRNAYVDSMEDASWQRFL